MKVRRVGVFSLAHVLGLIFALLGLILSVLFTLAMALRPGMHPGGPGMTWLGPTDGLMALVLLPLVYGGFAWITGLVTAVLYNFIAGWVGGVELELEPTGPESLGKIQ